jgi:hypothetical protein
MNTLGNPLLLIILALVAVVFINLLLIASVQSHAKNTSGKTVGRLLKSIKEPFQKGDGDLDELADLVEKIQQDSSLPFTTSDEESTKNK